MQDHQVLFCIDKLLKENKYSIEEIDEILPCSIQVTSRDSTQLYYLSVEGCEYFNATLEDLRALKNNYLNFIASGDPVSFVLNRQLCQSNNPEMIINYVDPVFNLKTGHPNPKMFIKTKKILSKQRQKFISIIYPIEKINESQNSFKKLLRNNHRYLTENYPKYISLSQKEKMIIQLLVKGLNSNHIAERLNNSVETIKQHRKNIHRKTGISGYFELLKFADTFINN